MEDWEARLKALDARLTEWTRSFERSLAQVCKERHLLGWFKRPAQVELDSAAVEARRRAGVDILLEVASFCDELCDHYRVSLPQERCKIRAEVGSHQALFDQWWGYVEANPERIHNASHGPQLTRALTAIAIDDMRADLHLVNDAMRRLLVAAAAAGLEWRGELAATAKLANRSTGGGGAQTREYFETFEQSTYFEQHVVKELAAAHRRSLQLQELSSGR